MRGPAKHTLEAKRRMRLGMHPEVRRARQRQMDEKKGVDRTPPGDNEKRRAPRGPDSATVLAHQKAAVKMGPSPSLNALAKRRASGTGGTAAPTKARLAMRRQGGQSEGIGPKRRRYRRQWKRRHPGLGLGGYAHGQAPRRT